jgi:hypothetical protein
MAACYLGCDALYEKGYITVGIDGKIAALSVIQTSEEVSKYIETLMDKTCKLYSDKNKSFFEHHHKFHLSRLNRPSLKV